MSGTAPSSGLPPVSAKARSSSSSCTSIWQRSNDRNSAGSATLMTGTPEQARIEALIADLRRIPQFADQPQADLEWFVAQSQEMRVEVGGVIVKEDTPAEMMFVVFEGEMRARRENGPQDGPVTSPARTVKTG